MIRFRLGSTTILRAWLPVNRAWALWREDAPLGAAPPPSACAWQLRLPPTAARAVADFDHRVSFLQAVVTLSLEARS